MAYDHRAIERRWQAFWAEHDTFRAEIDRERPKYYVLDMFPYPSGDGLHVGHVEGYTATDIVARYKRMRGFNVLHPMGWDAFGLPAERYAMKHGVHPAERIAQTTANFRRQLQRLGFSYDWSREINTTDPGYYRWTQWLFVRLWDTWYDPEQRRGRPIAELPVPSEVQAHGPAAVAAYRDERRLAYLADVPVNWCPELRVVLANEEVQDVVDDGYEVIRRPMRQWMLRITTYAERLLEDLDGLEWPPKIIAMQRNWIGRSEGAEITFAVQGHAAAITVFTTRPDTLYGATYMVLAPEHPLVAQITTAERRAAVDAYVDATAHRSERERQAASIEGIKTGEATGAFAVHPLTGAALPILIADYVLVGYGTGAIMAVPGHDERDHAFAQALGLPIVQVVAPADPAAAAAIDVQAAAYVDEGVAVNSGPLDGLPTEAAKRAMIERLEATGTGERRVTYKLRDWLFSRQRYWGEPFPLVHASDGQVRAVPDAELPVELPQLGDFNPSETGEPPLAKAKAWRELPDGALRETNTMPQWAGSCWYYLRFVDPSNTEAPWSAAAEDYWMPVDLYVGGVEHAVLHLLYARFWHKVFFDLGLVRSREPFARLVNPGMVLGATFVPADGRRGEDGKAVVFLPDAVDKVGEGNDAHYVAKATGERLVVQWDKMSKSRGNVVNPDELVDEYGADTVRVYEMYMGPLEASAPWQTENVKGSYNFLQRVYRLIVDETQPPGADGRPALQPLVDGEGTPRQRKLLHRTIARVTDEMERLAFNTAVPALMELRRDLVADGEPLPKVAAEQLVLLLAPLAPHVAEELWWALGHDRSLAHEPWPAADPQWLADDTYVLVVQVNGKRRGEVVVAADADEAALTAAARAVPEVARWLEGGTVRKVIAVPGRLVNFVVAG
jgi:leucyl-tRNA synthetase